MTDPTSRPKVKRNNGRTGSIHVRLEPDLKLQVEVESAARGVSAQWLIAKAIEDYIPRLIPVAEFTLVRPPQPDVPGICDPGRSLEVAE